MVDRSQMTDKECIHSLADCFRVVKEAEDSLRLFKQVLESSKAEFMRRFTVQEKC